MFYSVDKLWQLLCSSTLCDRLNTPPGTKLKLVGKVDICSGYLLLYKTNCKLLGGHVQSLVESWNLKRVSVSSSQSILGFIYRLLLFVKLLVSLVRQINHTDGKVCQVSLSSNYHSRHCILHPYSWKYSVTDYTDYRTYWWTLCVEPRS